MKDMKFEQDVHVVGHIIGAALQRSLWTAPVDPYPQNCPSAISVAKARTCCIEGFLSAEIALIIALILSGFRAALLCLFCVGQKKKSKEKQR